MRLRGIIVANEAARARAGATLLDSETPGWWLYIDPDTLSLGSCEGCVFGQTYGHFDTGRAELGLTRNQASAYGFLTEQWAKNFNTMPTAARYASWDSLSTEYRLLKAAWLVEIAARLGTPESEEAAIEASMAATWECPL